MQREKGLELPWAPELGLSVAAVLEFPKPLRDLGADIPLISMETKG